jgi:ribosomal protein S18 acetylase RimI-like enzyme
MAERGFRVHRPVEDDWEAVRELRLRALADTPIAYLETLEDAERRPEAFWRERIRGHDAGQSVQSVAIADDGTWVGSMVVLITQGPPAYAGLPAGGPPRANLVGVFVDPRWRGAGGVTDALLADLDDWVRGEGLSELHLHVAEDNLRARAAYVKRGFEETGERIRIPGDRDVDEIEMVATLPLEG